MVLFVALHDTPTEKKIKPALDVLDETYVYFDSFCKVAAHVRTNSLNNPQLPWAIFISQVFLN